jgi:hypothetical protein
MPGAKADDHGRGAGCAAPRKLGDTPDVLIRERIIRLADVALFRALCRGANARTHPIRDRSPRRETGASFISRPVRHAPIVLGGR